MQSRESRRQVLGDSGCRGFRISRPQACGYGPVLGQDFANALPRGRDDMDTHPQLAISQALIETG